MINEIIIFLKSNADLVNTLFVIIGILVGILIAFFQIQNSRKLATLESKLNNKSKVFADQYSKITQILEKMWILRGKIEDLLRKLEIIADGNTSEEIIDEFVNSFHEIYSLREQYEKLIKSSKFWIEETLYNSAINEIKVYELIHHDLRSLYSYLKKTALIRPRDLKYCSKRVRQHLDSETLKHMITTHHKAIINFEKLCDEKFNN